MGLAYLTKWGSLRYVANAAFIMMTHDRSTKVLCFGRKQLGYILGDTGRSFVVGFGTNSPTQPHHRASSCPDLPAPCSWNEYAAKSPNPQVLYGALVGGPKSSDVYEDVRYDYVANEVAIDYNSGFTGLLAALMQYPSVSC